MSKLLVTGANGFVGRHLCDFLSRQGHQVLGASRSDVDSAVSDAYSVRKIGDIGDKPDWSKVLQGADCVVHLAARVHVMRDPETDPLAAFRRVNVDGTAHLLRSAEANGVKRFIYLSTIKVLGDETTNRPFSQSGSEDPGDPYAQSKLEAEKLVEKSGSESGVETVIIRPPLVYGPGVRGNFARLLGLIHKGVPLPFGLVKNSRSLVSVENLCALISHCIDNPAAPGNRFLISDNEDISTPELVRRIASAMSRPARLVSVPTRILTMASEVTGQSSAMSRLTGSLEVDIGHTLQTLNWQPPKSMAEGIQSTVDWYQEQKKNG